MGLTISIHQPEHLPWRGFFNKMLTVDVFILLDHVQFTKNNWQNRNRVIITGSPSWLTVPVLTSGHLDKPLTAIHIDYRQHWTRKYLASLSHSYSKTPFFTSIFPCIEDIISSKPTLLVDLNIQLIDFFRSFLGINTPMLRSSTLDCTGSKSELLLSICQTVGASHYLSGNGASSYLNTSLFNYHQISVSYQSFHPKIYASTTYDPYLSILDLLFHHGPDSLIYI